MASAEHGSPTAFLHGAFAEWLKAPEVELQIYRDRRGVELTVIANDPDFPSPASQTFTLAEIPGAARSAGRKAMRKLLEEMRDGKE